ncbi:Auxin Efflux carrier [Mariprofundus erugo]|uniref:AEC family transporter n=1 Tax=Mariprofundus erugo TaxID=2528639 RepID=UPI0010FD11D1|nr:AEC family transporter [Mariprofundus erugo]TLS75788.1 Auxin Efflux carrier [Mariprofundus erugo]
MLNVLLGMAAIILAGIVWRLTLGMKSADVMRSQLAQGVYHVFLPALVIHVLWQFPIDLNTLRTPVVAALSVLLSLLVAFLLYGNGKLIRTFMPGNEQKAIGALLLACAFGNFSYLGLPVLSQTFGTWAQVVAIHFDLLASTPILFTVGIVLARHYGKQGEGMHPLLSLFQVPAIWAAIAGLLLSAFSIPMPAWLDKALTTLGAAVVPLMLLSVGMALRWQSGWLPRIPVLLPVVIIQLLIMPLIAWSSAIGVGMPEKFMAPVVIEAAMPTMVLGLVICDRFKLDVALYAEAVTLTTLLSMVTLPLWLQLIS